MWSVEDYRRFFADEIRFVANLESAALVEAFARVPREQFIGPGPWLVGSPELRALAAAGMGQAVYVSVDDPRHLYHNVVVALDASADINNGQPSALARWITALDLKPGDRVYHLGCGVGYYTAIMAEVVGPDGEVVASEVNPDLAARARENLSAYRNVEVHSADGAELDPGECDAMLINAGVTHPHSLWLDRLREGGRLVVPITTATSPTLGAGLMTKLVRSRGVFSATGVTPVGIYSCTGKLRNAELEPILRKALATQALFKVKALRREPHEEEETCLVHGADICLSSTEPPLRQS
ncbi:MAG TPA: methyltransferase domain-containing protein [Pyrinomonadaceae bacterium]|jgi:protein-L-isoaspartate(D-aspartate) O-methyltransferase|nr:methyltransferase domain-containing protein [Pyrinomonadaceae bacterium]